MYNAQETHRALTKAFGRTLTGALAKLLHHHGVLSQLQSSPDSSDGGRSRMKRFGHPATSGVGCRTSELIDWVAACVSIDSITWASDQTELKRLQKAKVFNETRSSHDAVGRASWKAGVLLRSSKNTANRPHAAKRFSRLRGSGSSRRCRTAIGLFPTEQWGPKKRHYHAWLCVNAAQSSGQQMRCAANAACVPSFLHRDHLGSAHAVGRNARGARVWRGEVRGGCAGDGSGIPACNAITARGEHQAGHRQGDDGVTPSPGGRRGLAASDLADASQERWWQRGCSFADSWWATRNTACQRSQWGRLEARRTGSAGSELAGNARALCHVSVKKLVGETQYWKVPHIQVERGDP